MLTDLSCLPLIRLCICIHIWCLMVFCYQKFPKRKTICFMQTHKTKTDEKLIKWEIYNDQH